MKLSLKERLYQYLLKNHGWVSSGDLQRLVMKYTTYLPRTTVRRLEELCAEGKLEVEYRKKNHAWYKIKEFQTAEQWFDSLPEKR